MSKLKNCPFCGCAVNYNKINGIFGWHSEKCFFQYLQDKYVDKSDEEIEKGYLEAWNKRENKSKALQYLAEGIMDINPEEIKSHDTEESMEQWIRAWRAFMKKWLWVLDQELKDWEGE